MKSLNFNPWLFMPALIACLLLLCWHVSLSQLSLGDLLILVTIPQNKIWLFICHLKIIIHLIIKLKYVCVCMFPIEFLFIFIQILPMCMCVHNRFTEIVTSKTAIFFFLPSIEFSSSVVPDSLWPHGLQHDRPPCPSLTPGVYSNSCPLSRWCHWTISSSVAPFFSHFLFCLFVFGFFVFCFLF